MGLPRRFTFYLFPCFFDRRWLCSERLHIILILSVNTCNKCKLQKLHRSENLGEWGNLNLSDECRWKALPAEPIVFNLGANVSALLCPLEHQGSICYIHVPGYQALP
jgi:hypothetical protein